MKIHKTIISFLINPDQLC